MADNRQLRVPPQSLESEQAVLGSIMLRPGVFIEIADKLSPESFYSDKHRKIYETMLELFSRNEPIDILSLSHCLQEKKILENIGGSRFITELANSVPSSTNAEYYADIVEQKYILRRLIESANLLSELGYDSKQKPLEEVLDIAEKEIFAIAESPKRAKYLTLKDTLSEAWDRIERLHEHKGELRGVPSGFAALDDMLSGFQNTDLIILAARPSMGKTTLALEFARAAATKHNIGVGFFSLEMSSQQLVDRMLAAESRVNAWSLRTGRLSSDQEFMQLRDSLDRLAKAPIYIEEQSASTVTHIRTIARRMKAEHNIGIIFIDYLQLITTTKNYDSMVNQITEVSHALKALAKDLNVPVIALSQLSRAVESRGGEPRLSDLRDSGSIEQDADIVMFIHREDKMNKAMEKNNIAKIMIEKHRNGPTGYVEIYFDEKTASYIPIEKGNMDDFSSALKDNANVMDVDF